MRGSQRAAHRTAAVGASLGPPQSWQQTGLYREDTGQWCGGAPNTALQKAWYETKEMRQRAGGVKHCKTSLS